MASLSARVNYVKSRLLSENGIKLKQNWVFSAIEFFLSQLVDVYGQANISNDELYLEIYEQFLLADIKDAGDSAIPLSALQNKDTFVLNETFVVQLLFLIDISESPYEQWRRLHNLSTDEVEDKRQPKVFTSKKKRIFKLELTDGIRNISAMEYLTIPVLTTKTPPGSKLQIIGPVRVVNNILLLEPKNFRILGGDVEDFSVINAYENVLLRMLGKPTTLIPVRDYKEDILTAEVPRAINFVPVSNPVTTNLLLDDEDDVDMDALMKIEQEERCRMSQESEKAENQMIISLDDGDDDFLAQIDLEAIENQEARASSATMEVAEVPEVIQPPTRKAYELLIPPNSRRNDSEDEEDAPVPRKIARVEPTRLPTFSDDFYRFKTHDGHPMVTIDQYMTLKPLQKVKKSFVIFGFVDKVAMNTLKVNGGQWRMSGSIADSYSNTSLSISFHNKILEKISGKTAIEMQALYAEVKSRPHTRNDIKIIVANLQKKLLNNDYFMKIEMRFNGTEPCDCLLSEILDENSENVQTFIKKLKEENIKKIE